jgi:hypothetical protein
MVALVAPAVGHRGGVNGGGLRGCGCGVSMLGDNLFNFGVPLLLTVVAKADGFPPSPSLVSDALGSRCMARAKALLGGGRC